MNTSAAAVRAAIRCGARLAAAGLRIALGTRCARPIESTAGRPKHRALGLRYRQFRLRLGLGRELDALGHDVQAQTRSRAQIQLAAHLAREDDAARAIDGDETRS